jgi:hypothetical protein
LQCGARRTSGGLLGNISEQDVGVGRALRGIHLTDPAEKIFDSAVVTLEYLLGWTHKTSLEATVELDDWRWNGRQTATTNPVDDMTVVHGGYEYTLRVVFSQFQVEDRPRADERSLEHVEWAELEIKSAEPTSFASFDMVVKAIMDLMTLVAHAPAGVLQETCSFTQPNDHPAPGGRSSAEVEVMGRHVHRPKAGDTVTARVDYLFTLDDIEFSDVLPRWLDLHEQTWLACSTLFGLRYVPGGYVSSRLLSAATAAESLHRALYPNAGGLPEGAFAALRARVMRELAGEDAESKAGRQFVSDRFRNDLTYKARLAALADLPDSDAVGSLIKDVDRWAKYLKDQRNGIAHGDRERLEGDSVPMAFYTLEVTVALLGLVLLSELGLSPEVQRRAAGLPYLATTVERFNRSMAQT